MKIESLRCNDVDLLNIAIRDANLEHHPLEKGLFDGAITRIDIGESVIDMGSYHSHLLCNGAYPDEMITFGAIIENASVCRFKSQKIPSTAIACMEESSEFAFNIAPDTTWTSFQVKRELLERIGLNPSIITETIQIHPDKNTTQPIINIRNLLSELKKLDDSQKKALNRQLVFDKMLSCYTDAYTQAENTILPIGRKSDSLAHRAYDFIVSHNYSAPSMESICLAVDTNIRTLQRSFKRSYGMSLRSFQQLHRLYLVRRELLYASDSTTVSNAALKYGFIHFGHFGRYYKQHFGELPSETLRNAYSRPNIIL